MVNVVVTKPRNVKVSTNATAGIINTSTPVTLKNTPTLISGNNLALENLLDVSVVSKTNGAVPVYDSVTNKFLIEQFTVTDVNVDGGTF